MTQGYNRASPAIIHTQEYTRIEARNLLLDTRSLDTARNEKMKPEVHEADDACSWPVTQTLIQIREPDQHANRGVTDGGFSACAALRGKMPETPVRNTARGEDNGCAEP
jgi:hypothetical protein